MELIDNHVSCPACGGTGKMFEDDDGCYSSEYASEDDVLVDCHVCGGQGRVSPFSDRMFEYMNMIYVSDDWTFDKESGAVNYDDYGKDSHEVTLFEYFVTQGWYQELWDIFRLAQLEGFEETEKCPHCGGCGIICSDWACGCDDCNSFLDEKGEYHHVDCENAEKCFTCGGSGKISLPILRLCDLYEKIVNDEIFTQANDFYDISSDLHQIIWKANRRIS